MFKARFTRPAYIPEMMTTTERNGCNTGLCEVKPGQEVEFMDASALSNYMAAVNIFYPGLVEAMPVPPTEGPWATACIDTKVWGIYGAKNECIATTDNTEGLTNEEIETNAHVLAAAYSMQRALVAILSEVPHLTNPKAGQPVRNRTAFDIERWARAALKETEVKR